MHWDCANFLLSCHEDRALNSCHIHHAMHEHGSTIPTEKEANGLDNVCVCVCVNVFAGTVCPQTTPYWGSNHSK